jgi:hypothetical protein
MDDVTERYFAVIRACYQALVQATTEVDIDLGRGTGPPSQQLTLVRMSVLECLGCLMRAIHVMENPP